MVGDVPKAQGEQATAGRPEFFEKVMLQRNPLVTAPDLAIDLLQFESSYAF